MTGLKKEVDEVKHTFDDPVMRNLGKLDIFLLSTIIVTVVSYYQIKEMFNTEHDLTIHISLVTGLIFSGILSLSLRQWTHKDKEKRQ